MRSVRLLPQVSIKAAVQALQSLKRADGLLAVSFADEQDQATLLIEDDALSEPVPSDIGVPDGVFRPAHHSSSVVVLSMHAPTKLQMIFAQEEEEGSVLAHLPLLMETLFHEGSIKGDAGRNTLALHVNEPGNDGLIFVMHNDQPVHLPYPQHWKDWAHPLPVFTEHGIVLMRARSTEVSYVSYEEISSYVQDKISTFVWRSAGELPTKIDWVSQPFASGAFVVGSFRPASQPDEVTIMHMEVNRKGFMAIECLSDPLPNIKGVRIYGPADAQAEHPSVLLVNERTDMLRPFIAPISYFTSPLTQALRPLYKPSPTRS